MIILFKVNERLSKPLRDDEIPKITKDDEDLNEDYEDENIETLIEQEEYNVDMIINMKFNTIYV